MKSSPLVLFDIDGTLVRRAGPHHREALAYGIRRVMGLETTTDGIPVQGMLDPLILTAMLRRAGARSSQIRASLAAIERAAVRYYLRVCPPIGDRLCPGVPAALAKLQRHGALLGLVTGNLTRIGWHKLERAGLASYFVFGAFGDMAPNRAALVKLAIGEARRRRSRRLAAELVGKFCQIEIWSERESIDQDPPAQSGRFAGSSQGEIAIKYAS